MSILIKGVEMPTKHFIKGFYIDGETGNVLDISRKRIIGHAVEISTLHGQTERKKGKWIESSVFDCEGQNEKWQSAKCSVCGKYHTTPYLYSFEIYQFCPHCGAKMKGE